MSREPGNREDAPPPEVAALKRELEELGEKNRELEQIIYITSHDLRSPLVNIDGFSGELKNSLGELKSLLAGVDIPADLKGELDYLLEEDLPESIRFILSGIEKINTLLSGLLRYSRLGRAALSMVDLDMNRMIEEVADTLEFQVKEKEATLTVSELPPARGDKVQINQVFTNLLDNALKFLAEGRPGKIAVSGKREKGRVVYCVEDNGVGILQGQEDKVFEIFQRINPGKTVGQGMGMTLVRKILHRHGGEVWFESTPGRGSRFFVSLEAPCSPEKRGTCANDS